MSTSILLQRQLVLSDLDIDLLVILPLISMFDIRKHFYFQHRKVMKAFIRFFPRCVVVSVGEVFPRGGNHPFDNLILLLPLHEVANQGKPPNNATMKKSLPIP